MWPQLLTLLQISAAIAGINNPGGGTSVGGGSEITNPGSAAPTYTGPIDIVASPTALYALRAGSAAIAAAATQQLINIRNTATSETCDVIVATNGGFGNVANCSASSSGDTVAVFCAESSGSCAVTEVYDQSGNGNVATQGTAADQPALTLNCINTTLPCMTFSGSSQGLGNSGITIAQPYTLAAVSARTGGFTSQVAIGWSTSSGILGYNSTTGVGFIFAGTVVNETVSNTSVHSLVGVYNGNGSSVFSVDGTASTGLSPGTGTFGIGFGLGCSNATCSSKYLTGTIMEFGAWAAAFTSTQYGNMCHNQYTYWATSTSC